MGEFKLSTPSTDITSGDAQRIKLINQVNCNLQGILYVFDEPSIGLSEAYQTYLLHVLNRLIRRGNTVMVVEHDLTFIQSADWIVELGPDAGIHGGEIVFNGTIKDFLSTKNTSSHTLAALKENQENTKQKTKPKSFRGAIAQRCIEPVEMRKRTDSFLPSSQELSVVTRKTPHFVQKIESFCKSEELNCTTVSDQPIGKTPRSNPSTYTFGR
jgi:excinuclease UvrABC ATPase subunit